MDNLCLIGAGILALLLIPKDNNKNNELEQANKNEELASNLEELKNELQEDKLEEKLENVEEELEDNSQDNQIKGGDTSSFMESLITDNISETSMSADNQIKGGDTSSFMESLTDNISDTSMNTDNQVKGGDTSNKILNNNKYNINKLFKQKQLDSYESDLSENPDSNLSRQYNFNKKNL